MSTADLTCWTVRKRIIGNETINMCVMCHQLKGSITNEACTLCRQR